MPPRIRLLTPADYRVMPWKNGQGTTTEIAASPPGADLATFTWRISMADIGASGPFSTFPGVDRVLIQTEGEPMRLDHEGYGSQCLALLVPVRFAGEWPTHGEVPAPPVRDFNVMSRRDQVRASVAVHELPPAAQVRAQGPASARAIHLLRGSLSVRALVTGEAVRLGSGDTCLLTGSLDDDTGFEMSVVDARPGTNAGVASAAVIVATFVER